MRARRLLAAAGDPTDPRVMSGLPYHFFLYGRREGVIDGVATRSLHPLAVSLGRYAWNAWRLLSLQGKGGHQYTRARTESVWLPLPDGELVVMNIFQLYPRHMLREDRIRRWYFIDQTLRQLFDSYGQGQRVGRDVVPRSLELETSGYGAAEFVIANSTWAAASLVEDYGVAEEKVGVVLQAANFHPDEYAAWSTARQAGGDGLSSEPEGPLRLVFVGGDWRRKGLDRLLRAVGSANSDRPRVTLDVVGCRPRQLPGELRATEHVTWHGYVDKRQDQRRFLNLLSSADVGCLLSRAEAGGNSLREYHAVGLAVLGTTAGGAPEQTLPEATWLVDADAGDDVVADHLRWLSDNRSEVEERKAVAWRNREAVLWPATLRGVNGLLQAHGA